MKLLKKLLTLLMAGALVFAPTACGDDPGEDEIGDGEINDSGD